MSDKKYERKYEKKKKGVKGECGCKERQIKIIFIRHGFSCANAKKASGLWGRISKSAIRDPALTNRGIDDVRKAARDMKGIKPDVVMSSTLLRAQQTASFLYPNKRVIVAPFISETGFGLDNTSNPPQFQEHEFRKSIRKYYNYNKARKGHYELKGKMMGQIPMYYGFVTGKRDYPLRNAKGIQKARVSWKVANKPSYNKFLFWLQYALPYLINKNKQHITVVVVGHSHFMKKNIETEIKAKPNNVGMVELNFCFDTFKVPYHVRGGKEINKELKLYSLSKNPACHCKKIQTLALKPFQQQKSKFCDGVIYTGFPVSKDKLRYGIDNC